MKIATFGTHIAGGLAPRSCVRQRIVRAFLIEEQKCVKQVLAEKLSQAKEKETGHFGWRTWSFSACFLQCRYNTKSNKQRVVKTPGGRAVFQTLTKKAKGPHCGDCHKALIGLPRLRPVEYARLKNREKRVNRAYGGSRCATLAGNELRAPAHRARLPHRGAEVREAGTDDLEPLDPVDALQKIAECLKEEEALKLQLVDCARVPVLTVWSEDGRLSLDLTVDQPLGEWHVLWFQSLWQWDPFAALPETLPPPIGEDKDHWSSGLEATALRCIKWWLRRRNIPVSKEGGYPTVVWTLMVLHVMRCSVFVNEEGKKEQGQRALLSAIAAFFDRFAGSGLMGTLCFSMGPDGVSSVFHPCEEGQALMDYTSETPGFSVLDPTTTCDLSVAYGVVPSELAPPLPPATRAGTRGT
eukprot:s361_g19.t1